MAEIPFNEPVFFTAGDTVQWRKQLTDYPVSEGWELVYSFRGQGPGQGFETAPDTDSGDHLVTLNPATTAPLKAGPVYYVAKVTLGDAVYTVSRGQIEVKADLTALSVDAHYDARSQTEKDLAAVEGAIRTQINGGIVQEYSIGNRSLRRYSLAELQELKKDLRAQINQKQQQQNLADGNPFLRQVLAEF